MGIARVGFRAAIQDYEEQAETLLRLKKSGDSTALAIVHQNHPRFLNASIRWLPVPMPDSDIQSASFYRADAQLTIARWYSFRDWESLTEYVKAVSEKGSTVQRFESAAEAVVTGDLTALRSLLRGDSGLVAARSQRVTKFDPPVHRATLLHYVAANGVEQDRQRTPQNAVEIARTLLTHGAVVDALADMYGAPVTTMSMLVSSSPPAIAGVQIALVDALADFEADVQAPLITALGHGFVEAGEALVRRGARIDTLEAAAGLGREEEARKLLTAAGPVSRHAALALAAQHGYAAVVRMLLDAGEDPNRYNPEGFHPHATPLHQAALRGHEHVVRLLVERGARPDTEDKFFHGTPREWALHGGHQSVAALL